MPQRKKLTLDEARAMFNDKPKTHGKKGQGHRSSYNRNSKRKSARLSPSMLEKRIAMLERKVVEGDLTEEEEAKILKEIESLENQK